MRTWRACVQSLRVDADGVSLTRSPGAPQAEFRLHAPYAVSDGDPTLVRLGGPADVLGGAMGYHFAAFTDLRRNAQGQVIEARGKILLCPGADEVTSGIARSDDRCVARTLDALRRAAVLELRDDSDPPFRLRWMAALA